MTNFIFDEYIIYMTNLFCLLNMKNLFIYFFLYMKNLFILRRKGRENESATKAYKNKYLRAQ